MSIEFKTKNLAPTLPVEPSVCLLPCYHNVQRAFAEKHYGKMMDGFCKLRDERCTLCNEEVEAYASIEEICFSRLGKLPHRLPYPGLPAVFVLGKERDWNRIFDSGAHLCREVSFESTTDNSVLKRFDFCGYWNGSVSIAVTFQEKAHFDSYLLWHRMACSVDFFYITRGVQELKTLFCIIASNNEIPAEQLKQMSEIVERGAYDPSPIEDRKAYSSQLFIPVCDDHGW